MSHAPILALALLLSAANASASCVRVDYVRPPAPDRADYVDPAYGSTGTWSGASDLTGGRGSLPSVLNVEGLAFQPVGSLVASGVVRFIDMGQLPYRPDQVLFRCTPDEAGKLYEFYSINGENDNATKYDDGAAIGLPAAYHTGAAGLLLRVTNATTGEAFIRTWKSRVLTGLQLDSAGYLLVKAHNFSDARLEVLRIDSNLGWQAAGSWPRNIPVAYIAFKGGGLGLGLSDGVAFSTGGNQGWFRTWPGAINLAGVRVRRSATCSAAISANQVLFGTITQGELAAGINRSQPLAISLQCHTGPTGQPDIAVFSSGTALGDTAMGILVQPANAAAAVAEGLGTAGAGVRYLLADDYGVDPAVATGVGIEFTRENAHTPLNLLTSLASGGSGWYPVLDGAIAVASQQGVSIYTHHLTATLKNLPGKTVKSGRVTAQAQIIVQVQ